ncbi:hypothetical protein L4D20_21510 [Vibrio kyushuensis]|uniref:hypothetical protein n=1 Tax=Vibrio kyushuensis TaxID=2910249 RepID=UPI003D1506E6
MDDKRKRSDKYEYIEKPKEFGISATVLDAAGVKRLEVTTRAILNLGNPLFYS